MGGDEDPIPPDGNLHPMPHAPFGGIWHDADFAHNEEPHAAPAVHHAPDGDHENIPMVYTPPQDPENSHADHPLQPAVEAADAFFALHDMMSKIISSAPEVLGILDGVAVISTRVQMMIVMDTYGPEKKCLQLIV